MKPLFNVTGMLLIILGILGLAYQGFIYTEKEQIAQIGEVKITTNTEKILYFSPTLAGASLTVGVVLVLIGSRRDSGRKKFFKNRNNTQE